MVQLRLARPYRSTSINSALLSPSAIPHLTHLHNSSLCFFQLFPKYTHFSLGFFFFLSDLHHPTQIGFGFGFGFRFWLELDSKKRTRSVSTNLNGVNLLFSSEKKRKKRQKKNTNGKAVSCTHSIKNFHDIITVGGFVMSCFVRACMIWFDLIWSDLLCSCYRICNCMQRWRGLVLVPYFEGRGIRHVILLNDPLLSCQSCVIGIYSFSCHRSEDLSPPYLVIQQLYTLPFFWISLSPTFCAFFCWFCCVLGTKFSLHSVSYWDCSIPIMISTLFSWHAWAE